MPALTPPDSEHHVGATTTDPTRVGGPIPSSPRYRSRQSVKDNGVVAYVPPATGDPMAREQSHATSITEVTTSPVRPTGRPTSGPRGCALQSSPGPSTCSCPAASARGAPPP